VCQKTLVFSRGVKIYTMVASGPDPTNRLMTEFRSGSPEAAGKLVDLFYPELRRLASSRMLGERIKALPPDSSANEDEKNAFFGLAAFLMRRLLVHHARPLAKRMTKTDINEALGMAASGETCLGEIEDLLSRLHTIDPKLRVVVEMKVFEGLSREEIAQRLRCSVRTVARHWDFAQHWLQKAISVDGHA
jgi:RNA polymerase sigma factor (TIGR02999 family)